MIVPFTFPFFYTNNTMEIKEPFRTCDYCGLDLHFDNVCPLYTSGQAFYKDRDAPVVHRIEAALCSDCYYKTLADLKKKNAGLEPAQVVQCEKCQRPININEIFLMSLYDPSSGELQDIVRAMCESCARVTVNNLREAGKKVAGIELT